MKFVVFGQKRRLGLLEGERVLDLAGASARAAIAGRLRDAFGSLHRLIVSGERGLEATAHLAETFGGSDESDVWIDVAKADLAPPWPGQRFALIGNNNAAHVGQTSLRMRGATLSEAEIQETARRSGLMGYWGMARPVLGPGSSVPIPVRANGLFDYEAEPAIVLGKQGKDIRAENLADHVWGVTLVADWGIREERWPPGPYSPLMPTKNFDGSKSIGPCIVVGEIDPDDLEIETFINAQQRQRFCSSEMIFSIGEILELLSENFTFFPGDVISGGSGPGTALDQTTPHHDGSWPRDLFLKDGDVVEMRAAGIGSLVSHIVGSA